MSKARNRNKYKVREYLQYWQVTDSSPALKRVVSDLLEHSEYCVRPTTLDERQERLMDIELYHYYCYLMNAEPHQMLDSVLHNMWRFWTWEGDSLSYHFKMIGEEL